MVGTGLTQSSGTVVKPMEWTFFSPPLNVQVQVFASFPSMSPYRLTVLSPLLFSSKSVMTMAAASAVPSFVV